MDTAHLLALVDALSGRKVLVVGDAMADEFVYGRVARTLLDMAEEEKGVKIIRGKVSRQDMAKVVGASREMVSRVMKDLEDKGVIETLENGSVVIKERLQHD